MFSICLVALCTIDSDDERIIEVTPSVADGYRNLQSELGDVLTVVLVEDSTEQALVLLDVLQQVSVLACCVVSREVEGELMGTLVDGLCAIVGVELGQFCNVLQSLELAFVMHIGLHSSWVDVHGDSVHAIVSPEPLVLTFHAYTAPVEELHNVAQVDDVAVGLSVNSCLLLQRVEVDRTLPACEECTVANRNSYAAVVRSDDTNIGAELLGDVSVILLIADGVQNVLSGLVVDQLQLTSLLVEACNLSVVALVLRMAQVFRVSVRVALLYASVWLATYLSYRLLYAPLL